MDTLCHTTRIGHLYHPWCKSLSIKQSIIYTLCSVALGLFTGGITHIWHYVGHSLANRVKPLKKQTPKMIESKCIAVVQPLMTFDLQNQTFEKRLKFLLDFYNNEEIKLIDKFSGLEKS